MAAAGGGGARRGLLKRKPNFTLQELEVLMSEVLRYEPLLFGAAAGTVNAYEKQKIWWRITHKVNAAGRHQRDIGEVKNRWRGLRRRAGDKISRHRLERQGPAGRAAARNGNTGSTGNNGSNGNGAAEPGPGPAPSPVWGPRGAAGTDPLMRSAEGSVQHGEYAGSGGWTGQGHGDAGRTSGETDMGGSGHGHGGKRLGQERTGQGHGDAWDWNAGGPARRHRHLDWDKCMVGQGHEEPRHRRGAGTCWETRMGHMHGGKGSREARTVWDQDMDMGNQDTDTGPLGLRVDRRKGDTGNQDQNVSGSRYRRP